MKDVECSNQPPEIRQLSPFTRVRLKTVNGKKVREHRWLMEQLLGRKLGPEEQVHHINGDPRDNRIENLVVMNAAEHMRLHKQKYPSTKVCEVCGSEYEPNVRKRKRQKTCSKSCANILRARSMSITRYGAYNPKLSIAIDQELLKEAA